MMNSEFRWYWDDAHDSYIWFIRENRETGGSEHQRCIDFTSGIFAANLGHANAAIYRYIFHTGIHRQSNMHTYTYPTRIRERYEAKLCEWTGYEACHLFTTGSEAVEAALRVMGIDKERPICAIGDCFHGKTYGPRKMLKRIWGGDAMKYGWQQWILEGYRGWDCTFWGGGFIDYLKECQGRGHLICFDEIQSGFGRTGRKFAYEHYDIQPDILVIGKGMGSGFPVSAIVSSKNLLETHREDFSSTHGGGPLACAAGLATIEEFERLDLINEAARKGEVLHDVLRQILPVGRESRTVGRGLVGAVLTTDIGTADSIVLRCRENGLLLVHTGKASVKIGPPLTISDDVLLEGLEILKGVLDDS